VLSAGISDGFSLLSSSAGALGTPNRTICVSDSGSSRGTALPEIIFLFSFTCCLLDNELRFYKTLLDPKFPFKGIKIILVLSKVKAKKRVMKS
jgi:hypothetical protein